MNPIHQNDEAVYHPEAHWKQRWTGRWQVLVYDVPESNRRYREQLRRVLLQYRCGCLQGSVWISTRDLRPLFADLDEAAALSSMAYLLEARTVLGRSQMDLVEEAWDFDHLQKLHTRYRADVAESLPLLQSITNEAHLAALAYQESAAFRTLIDNDPLLPAALHPPSYTGREILAQHQRFVKQLHRRGTILRQSSDIPF
jgi:phenylacetic acid degradation operon negative regulatory protein